MRTSERELHAALRGDRALELPSDAPPRARVSSSHRRSPTTIERFVSGRSSAPFGSAPRVVRDGVPESDAGDVDGRAEQLPLRRRRRAVRR